MANRNKILALVGGIVLLILLAGGIAYFYEHGLPTGDDDDDDDGSPFPPRPMCSSGMACTRSNQRCRRVSRSYNRRSRSCEYPSSAYRSCTGRGSNSCPY